MAANKIGCARISMMVRSTSSKARPDTLVQDRTPGSPFSLATHGGSIHFGGKADIGRGRCLVGPTRLTHSGHRSHPNPAVQRSLAPLWCANPLVPVRRRCYRSENLDRSHKGGVMRVHKACIMLLLTGISV